MPFQPIPPFSSLLTKQSTSEDTCTLHPTNEISCESFAITAAIAVLTHTLPEFNILPLHRRLFDSKMVGSLAPASDTPLNNLSEESKDRGEAPPMDQTAQPFAATITNDLSSLDEKKAETTENAFLDAWHCAKVEPPLLNLCSKSKANTALKGWITYFQILRHTLTTFEPAFQNTLAFILRNSKKTKHAITIGWNPRKQNWIFIDKGRLELPNSRPVQLFAAGEEEKLAETTRLALSEDYDISIFTTTLYVKKPDLEKATQYLENCIRSHHAFSIEEACENDKHGDSLLHCAVQHNLVSTVQRILKTLDQPGPSGISMSPDFLDREENTPLHWAAMQGNTEIVRQLIAADADPIQRNEKNKTALQLARENNQMPVVKQLIKQLAKQMVQAKLKPLAIVEEIQEAKCIDMQDKRGETLLHWAAREGQLELVNLLLDAKANPAISIDSPGGTPLFQAAENNHPHVVERLIEMKAHVWQTVYVAISLCGHQKNLKLCHILELLLKNKKDAAAEDGSRSLYLAASHQSIFIIQQLLEQNLKIDWAACEAATCGDEKTLGWLLKTYKCNANACTPQAPHLPALYLAARNGNTTIVKQLIEYKASIPLAMMKAVAMGDEQSIEVLLNSKGDVNSRDEETNCTVLYTAAQYGDSAIVERLIKRGAQIDALNGRPPETALQAAAAKGHEAVVKQLLKAMREKGLHIFSSTGHNPLHTAASHGQIAIVKELIKEAVEDKVDVNLPIDGLMGPTALHLAAEKGYESVIEQLLNANAQVNKLMENAQSALLNPLCVAAENGQLAVVNQLLKHNASLYPVIPPPSLRNKSTQEQVLETSGALAFQGEEEALSALVLAAEKGHVDIVNALLPKEDKASDLFVKRDYLNAFMRAVKGDKAAVVRVLLDHGLSLHFFSFPLSNELSCALAHQSASVVQLLLAAEMKENEPAAKKTYLNVFANAKQAGVLSIINCLLDFPVRRELLEEEQLSVLKDAATQGHTDIVKKIVSIESKEKPLFTQQKYCTALSIAAEHHHTPLVITLLDCLITIPLLPKDQLLVLSHAVALGHLPTVQRWLPAEPSDGFDYEKYQLIFSGAIKHGHTPIIQFLLTSLSGNHYFSSTNWLDVLIHAAANGHVDMIERAPVISFEENNSLMKKKCLIACNAAIKRGDATIINTLFQRQEGANWSTIYLSSDDYLAGLREATTKGNTSVVNILTKKVGDALYLFREYYTEIFSALLHHSKDCADLIKNVRRLLMDFDKDPIDILNTVMVKIDELQLPPLEVKEFTGLDRVKKILAKYDTLIPKDKSLMDSFNGPIPINISAIAKKLLTITREILQTGPGKSILTLQRNYCDLLSQAIRSKQGSIVTALLEYVWARFMLTSSYFEPEFLTAIQNKDEHTAQALFQYRLKTMQEYLKHNRPCRLAPTPGNEANMLLAAMHHGLPALVTQMLCNDRIKNLLHYKMDASPTAKTVGEELFYIAAIGGYTLIMKQLITYRVNPTLVDGRVLCAAISNGHAHAVRLLLNCHADANVQYGSGRSALWIAVCHRQFEIINMLRARYSKDHRNKPLSANYLREKNESSHFNTIRLLLNADEREVAEQYDKNKNDPAAILIAGMTEQNSHYHKILIRSIQLEAAIGSVVHSLLSQPPPARDSLIDAPTPSADAGKNLCHVQQTPENHCNPDGSSKTDDAKTSTAHVATSPVPEKKRKGPDSAPTEKESITARGKTLKRTDEGTIQPSLAAAANGDCNHDGFSKTDEAKESTAHAIPPSLRQKKRKNLEPESAPAEKESITARGKTPKRTSEGTIKLLLAAEANQKGNSIFKTPEQQASSREKVTLKVTSPTRKRKAIALADNKPPLAETKTPHLFKNNSDMHIAEKQLLRAKKRLLHAVKIASEAQRKRPRPLSASSVPETAPPPLQNRGV